jgi:membrane protease YdiL (CAAX protease family)
MSAEPASPAGGRTISRRAAVADVAVVLGCSAVYVVVSLAGVRIGWIMPIVAVVLVAYGWLVLRRRKETWRDYGVRIDNLVPASRLVGAWTLIAAAAILGWAHFRGATLWHADLAIMLPLYPAWGFVQQFIFQGIVHRRLIGLVARPLALILTAAAFGLVHVDDRRVAALTAVAGLGWSYCYQREPNIWLLGLSHGLLAALAYPLVIGENPLQRLF